MKKFLVILIMSLAITACSPTASETSDSYKIPEELNDCKFFYLYSPSKSGLNVVRCPNSSVSTTYMQGKTPTTTVTIDGVIYTRKEVN